MSVDDLHVSFEVRTPSGKKYMLNDIHLETTISEVRDIIVKQDSTQTADTIKLIKSGKVLDNGNQTVKEAGIENGSVIHMVKKLAGNHKNDPTAHQVTVETKVTAAGDRGYMTIKVPLTARPGTKLIITPPGRTQQLHVTVPQGHPPGAPLRVRLPDESNDNQPPGFGYGNKNTGNSGAGGTGSVPSNTPAGSGKLMKVLCPPNVNPGSEILIEVPGHGRMRVKVPPNVRPGEYFYFRLPN